MLNTRSDLISALAAPSAPVLEHCMRHSARNRFDDLVALERVIALVPGFERQAAEIGALRASLTTAPDTDPRLRSPILRGWLSNFAHLENWADTADATLVRHLDRAGNMRVSLSDPGDWTALLAVDDSVIATWDCRIALDGVPGDLVGAAKQGQMLVLIDQEGAHHNIDLTDTTDPRILRAPSLDGIDVVVRNDIPWLRLHLRDDGLPARDDPMTMWGRDPQLPHFPQMDPAPILEAAGLLRAHLPARYAELGQALRVIVPRLSPGHIYFNSFTSSAHQGACWLSPGDALAHVADIVHELGHVTLRYIEEAAPILAPEQTSETFRVDWRDDPRPIVGIFEGVYVHAHIALALEGLLAAGALGDEDRCVAAERAQEVRREVEEALPILRQHARFTPIGMAFLDWADSVVRADAALV